MLRWEWMLVLLALVVAVGNGCSASRRNGEWSANPFTIGRGISNWIGDSDIDIDKSRRDWDQTSDSPFR